MPLQQHHAQQFVPVQQFVPFYAQQQQQQPQAPPQQQHHATEVPIRVLTYRYDRPKMACGGIRPEAPAAVWQ